MHSCAKMILVTLSELGGVLFAWLEAATNKNWNGDGVTNCFLFSYEQAVCLENQSNYLHKSFEAMYILNFKRLLRY